MKSAILLVALCVATIFALPAKRDLSPFFLQEYDLTDVWTDIEVAGFGGQFQDVLARLLLSNQNQVQQAKAVFKDLVSNLKSNTVDVSVACTQALKSLRQILSNPKRDLSPFFLQEYGLTDVWTDIEVAGYAGQFQDVLARLLLSNQNQVQQAKAVFQVLVNNLKNNSVNQTVAIQQALSSLNKILNNNKRDLSPFFLQEFDLTDVWSEIEALGYPYVGQLQEILTRLLLGNQNQWQQAKAVFKVLVSNLKDHTVDASVAVSQAITSLRQILSF